MKTVQLVCVIVGLYAPFKAGRLCILGLRTLSVETSRLRLPNVTLLLALTVAVPTTLQFFFPEILSALRRDFSKFAAGDWWRLVTPLFVQDAGVAGALFNLVSLLMVASVAEQIWGWKRMLWIFFLGGILSEAVAMSWQPVGAGNSVANFSLAASISVACLVARKDRFPRMLACLGLAAGIVLLVSKDIHGAAALIGAVLALSLVGLNKRMLQRFTEQ